MAKRWRLSLLPARQLGLCSRLDQAQHNSRQVQAQHNSLQATKDSVSLALSAALRASAALPSLSCAAARLRLQLFFTSFAAFFWSVSKPSSNLREQLKTDGQDQSAAEVAALFYFFRPLLLVSNLLASDLETQGSGRADR